MIAAVALGLWVLVVTGAAYLAVLSLLDGHRTYRRDRADRQQIRAHQRARQATTRH